MIFMENYPDAEDLFSTIDFKKSCGEGQGRNHREKF